MKNILFLLILAAVVTLGCKKDEPEPASPTTYQIVNDNEVNESTIEFLDGTLYEIVVFAYTGDDIARQDNVDPVGPSGSKSDIIEVPDTIEKIKISFKFLPKESPYYNLSSNNRKYVVSYTFLEKGKNNQVIIDGQTMVSGELKISLDQIIIKDALAGLNSISTFAE